MSVPKRFAYVDTNLIWGDVDHDQLIVFDRSFENAQHFCHQLFVGIVAKQVFRLFYKIIHLSVVLFSTAHSYDHQLMAVIYDADSYPCLATMQLEILAYYLQSKLCLSSRQFHRRILHPSLICPESTSGGRPRSILIKSLPGIKCAASLVLAGFHSGTFAASRPMIYPRHHQTFFTTVIRM